MRISFTSGSSRNPFCFLYLLAGYGGTLYNRLLKKVLSASEGSLF